MLKFYLSEDTIPENTFFDAEELFSMTTIDGCEADKTFIREIEEGTYMSPSKFIDRFGRTLSIDDLSMGCKTALAVYHNPDKVCNATEIGINALSSIIKHCKDGAIIIYDLKYSFDTLCIDDIDVLYKGYRFTSFQRFADYMYEEWPYTPDLDWEEGGVEKCF